MNKFNYAKYYFGILSILYYREVSAQNLVEMLQGHMQQNNAQLNDYLQAQGSAIQQQEQQLLRQTMQNPEVQGRYQEYLRSGGSLPFEQYAYYYSASGGFSAQGVARYNQQTGAIGQRNRQGLQDYNNSQFNSMQEVQQSREQSFDYATRQRGNALMGTTDYIDPNTGERYNLATPPQRDIYQYDQNRDELFYNDESGQQYRQDSGGYWNPLVEEE